MGLKRWDVRVLKGWWQIWICPRCSSSTIPFQWMCQRGSKSGKHLFYIANVFISKLVAADFPLLLFNLVDNVCQPTRCQPHWDSGKTVIVESTIVTKRPGVVVFNDSLFSPLPGEMIQFKECVFQMGWNHQLDKDLWSNYILQIRNEPQSRSSRYINHQIWRNTKYW